MGVATGLTSTVSIGNLAEAETLVRASVSAQEGLGNTLRNLELVDSVDNDGTRRILCVLTYGPDDPAKVSSVRVLAVDNLDGIDAAVAAAVGAEGSGSLVRTAFLRTVPLTGAGKGTKKAVLFITFQRTVQQEQ